MKTVLTKTGLEILKALAYVIDTDEDRKLYHSWRVALMAKYLAEEKRRESVLPLYIAGLLHDVGTFDLTNRRGHLENSKVGAIRTHPQKGAAIVASLGGFIPISKIILNHHEWPSGEGYPRGLKRSESSLESQILRIADKFAFLIDTNMVTEITGFQRALKDRIDREFSRDLFDCLVRRLRENNTWDSIANTKKLSEITHRIFSRLPSEKEKHFPERISLLHFFGRILDAKHAYTEGHSWRVSYFSVLIALALDLSDNMIEEIESAAFLHDIGKIGIPKSILDKPGPLTPKEATIIRKHASISHNIVKGISVFEELACMVGADQEHWDGSGYPQGLKMKEIPLGARIIFVADAFDAMTSNRSYHKAISVKDAIRELKKCSGTDFDPEIVSVAVRLFDGFDNSSILACYSRPSSTS